ncbi:monovalent cation:proton antiporter-2 (CPA2) family protein [Flavobacterium coralii]|uniref:monovalent cation:proton antiporter-2 (CPA2) family protein n=1 Tax=Flavobacterium coralii TaxID=2838017 RepID=UPI000C42DAF3|nr:monovalent cation:proton antiporter-2 (CPA2) family protein [Flavobacterium coralii]MBE99007.1 potassium transporter [Flavobacterium sp.]MBY8962126.1 monovalent cation:proton antiporter-2 (CPA2) family protein [Flavobacterium coralii]|tara:strand:+ start:4479 stop:6392 length:1914 start_codon:yes stop_codon:yes gene_type:complete
MENGFFFEAIIYLSAAVICVPIAKKLGLSSILGYLFAGIIIGPYMLGLIGQEGEDIMHFAEFGVVMMLFLIGLELDPYKFWRMRKFIFGMGLLQVVATTLILFLACSLVLRWQWETTLVISMALTLSSTAIVMQTLKEKNLTKTSMGRSSFAVLLFQDIAVIPILALLPFLAGGNVQNENVGHSLINGFSPWLQAAIVFGAIAAVYFAGRYIIVPLLHIVAKTRLQELFTASALLLVMAVSYLMQLVGLSPALGAFMAGVVLANSEFRHELEGDIEPFKGLLLGLFFIGVGASINFTLIFADPAFIIVFTTIFNIIKFFVLAGIGRLYKKSSDQNLLFAFALSQAGEFGFVILGFANQLNLMPTELSNQMMAIIALSMVGTPFLLLINERWIDPYFGVKERQSKKDYDTIDEDEKNDVIIAGFGNFGSTIGRLLKANGIPATVLDMNSERVDSLRKMGFKVYYGDATRLELLTAAGCESAKIFIAAIDNPQVNLSVIEKIKKHFPHLKILARARNRTDAFEMVDIGLTDFYRENLYSAVHLGVDALVELGHRRYTATRQGQRFIKYDEQATFRLAHKRHDKKAFLITSLEEIEMQEQLIKGDLYAQLGANDHAWESEDIKREHIAEVTLSKPIPEEE